MARRSILIVGWDFDGRVKLCPEAGEDEPPLSDLLHARVEACPELEIRILSRCGFSADDAGRLRVRVNPAEP